MKSNNSVNYNSPTISSLKDELSRNLTEDEVWNMELDIYHSLVPTAPQFTPTSTTNVKVLFEKLEKVIPSKPEILRILSIAFRKLKRMDKVKEINQFNFGIQLTSTPKKAANTPIMVKKTVFNGHINGREKPMRKYSLSNLNDYAMDDIIAQASELQSNSMELTDWNQRRNHEEFEGNLEMQSQMFENLYDNQQTPIIEGTFGQVFQGCSNGMNEFSFGTQVVPGTPKQAAKTSILKRKKLSLSPIVPICKDENNNQNTNKLSRCNSFFNGHIDGRGKTMRRYSWSNSNDYAFDDIVARAAVLKSNSMELTDWNQRRNHEEFEGNLEMPSQMLENLYDSQQTPIGEGMFGQVFQGCYNGISVAIKIQSMIRKRTQRQFLKEKNLAFLRNTFILPVLAFSDDAKECMIVMYPYMAGGDLKQVLGYENGLPWDIRLRILYQCSEGLSYLHTAIPNI